METAQPVEDENDNAVSAGEGADEPPAQTTAVNMSKILAERCPDLTAEVLKSRVSESAHSDEEEEAEQAALAWPEYFEHGRYEGVPNEVYHAANGISSTMVKDARVSLMYFEARHVSKTIQKVRSPVLDMGNLVHALALQPDQLEKEFSIEPEIPEGAFTTTATIRAFIDEYNNGLPPLLSADDIKALLEAHNASLIAPSAPMRSKHSLKNTTLVCQRRPLWGTISTKQDRATCLCQLISSALKKARNRPRLQ